MPMLGLGTWQNTDPDQCVESIRTALEMGYRHVDTAQNYGNEAAVGDGVAAADVDREEVFVATKIWHSDLAYEAVHRSFEASLEKLGVDYVDLLYVHWPARTYDPGSTLRAFDELHDEGRIRHVGVSNFTPDLVEEARDHLDAPVFANQVEVHPFHQQEELRTYAEETDLELVAYSPLARGAVLDDRTLSAIADDHGASPVQVGLAWLREKGITAIPKATGDHIGENWESLALELDNEEIARIDAIDRNERLINPSFAPEAWG